METGVIIDVRMEEEPLKGTAGRTPGRIGHYAIARKLGQGGMGVVYAAHDERLQRTVALKTMKTPAGDDSARQRFWREARSAASVNHPNICQIYEIGEDGGELFIAMELLEGESLADRLRRGPMSVSDALPVALGILAALSELHARGIVHRDLKPSNVFLTRHGVKLLDFGLARPGVDASTLLLTGLTEVGTVVGTPRYMAPEQVRGEPVDHRCDLFAAGTIVFEMLAGRPAFDGGTAVEVLHATLHEQPPALTGSPAVAAMDRVIRRALSKRPADRPSSAEAMAGELRGIHGIDGDSARALARAVTRIVVLPFRVLRPDPETDFLGFSLADAIATSLSGIGSLVARRAAAAYNMKVIAFDPYVAPEKAREMGITVVPTSEDVFRQADVVSMHTPLTPETRGFVNTARLRLMKPSAFLINFSRGEVVDEKALYTALKTGVIAGAAIDVYDPEPPRDDNPLYELENIILSPHSAALTQECVIRMAVGAAEGVVDVLSGRTPRFVVNPEALKK